MTMNRYTVTHLQSTGHYTQVSFMGLCSMNLCSKIKYHAALHQKGHLFKREVQPFKPTVRKYVPESFLQKFAPDKDQLQRIPRNGLPLDSDDIEVRTQVKNLWKCINYIFFVSLSFRMRHMTNYRRQQNPTTVINAIESPLFLIAQAYSTLTGSSLSDWTRTKESKLGNASKKSEMSEELRAMATSNVPEKDLTRRFSRRDMFRSRK